ncbi:MAG: MFS transporter, partial [Steroidobacteraceae bacterium]
MLIGLLSAASIVVLDFFIVLACLPSIEQTLGASKAQLQLILASYAVANASLLVVGGRLGDALGRKRVMTLGVLLFAVASLACGLATSPWILIAFRVLQGLAGALVQPQVLGLLSVNFDDHEKPRIFGLYAAALGFAGVAAQLLGGLFVGLLPDNLGWRVCFIVTVPLCCFALVWSARAREGAHASSRSIDLLGSILLGVG